VQEAEIDATKAQSDDKVLRSTHGSGSDYENEEYENEGYDDFEDDVEEPLAASQTGESGKNRARREMDDCDDYMGDTLSDGELSSRGNTAHSRGNTAMSGATTLPRTRKGTRQGSRHMTPGSDGGISPLKMSSAHQPTRLYMDSIDGGTIK
jgi:hypothetical protein